MHALLGAIAGLVVGALVRVVAWWAVLRFPAVRRAVVVVGGPILLSVPLLLIWSAGWISTEILVIVVVVMAVTLIGTGPLDRWRTRIIDRRRRSDRAAGRLDVIGAARTEGERRYAAFGGVLMWTLAPLAVLFAVFAAVSWNTPDDASVAYVVGAGSRPCTTLVTPFAKVARSSQEYDLSDPATAFEIRERDHRAGGCPARTPLSTVRYDPERKYVAVPANNGRVGGVVLSVVALICAGLALRAGVVRARLRRRAG